MFFGIYQSSEFCKSTIQSIKRYPVIVQFGDAGALFCKARVCTFIDSWNASTPTYTSKYTNHPNILIRETSNSLGVVNSANLPDNIPLWVVVSARAANSVEADGHVLFQQVDAWAQSNTVPGLFTGSTGAQVLSSEELSNSGPQAWLKKVRRANDKSPPIYLYSFFLFDFFSCLTNNSRDVNAAVADPRFTVCVVHFCSLLYIFSCSF